MKRQSTLKLPGTYRELFMIMLLGFLLAYCSSVRAAVYVIASSGGNDTSLSHFLNGHSLNPGDIVQVQADSPGGTKTYYDAPYIPGSNESGNPTNYVTIQARAGDTVLLDGSGTNNSIFNLSSVDYIRINNFVLTNFIGVGIWQAAPNTSGYWISSNTFWMNFVISNENVHCAVAVGHPAGGTAGVLYEYNLVTNQPALNLGHDDVDGMRVSTCSNVVVRYNYIYKANTNVPPDAAILGQGHDDGIQMWDVANVSVYGNQVYTPFPRGYQQGIFLEAYTNTLNGPWRLYNNVVKGFGSGLFIQSSHYNYGPQIFYYGNTAESREGASGFAFNIYGTNVLFKNNVIISDRTNNAPNYYAISFQYTNQSASLIDYNRYYHRYATGTNTQLVISMGGAWQDSFSQWQSLGFDAHGLYGNPQFDSRLRPVSGSPVIHAAVELTDGFPDLNKDVTGQVRNIPWDLGAYEYNPSLSLPGSPQNLRVVPQ